MKLKFAASGNCSHTSERLCNKGRLNDWHFVLPRLFHASDGKPPCFDYRHSLQLLISFDHRLLQFIHFFLLLIIYSFENYRFVCVWVFHLISFANAMLPLYAASAISSRYADIIETECKMKWEQTVKKNEKKRLKTRNHTSNSEKKKTFPFSPIETLLHPLSGDALNQTDVSDRCKCH